MRDFQRKPEVTADGSVTLYIPEIDEHYHSVNGAVVEAKHVYIREALLHYIEKVRSATSVSETTETVPTLSEAVPVTSGAIRVLEVGFGTGLNAFLTLLKAGELQIPIHYTTLELYPLTPEQIALLNYPLQADEEQAATRINPDTPQRELLYQALHTAAWNEPVVISPYFTLEKRHIDLTQVTSLTQDAHTGLFDVVFFDAFAPDKQPEMWTEAIYSKIADAVSDQGVLTTYCAKGVVRRGFRDAGFEMERIPGPPGKREMIRGTRKR